MKLAAIVRDLELTALTPELTDGDSPEVAGGYASDLLSDVLAHAPQGGVLVTAQVHLNVIAVAAHTQQAAVIFPLEREPEEAVRERALEEGVPLYMTDASAFDIAGRLYELGLRGPCP
jgi:hypothetical protein